MISLEYFIDLDCLEFSNCKLVFGSHNVQKDTLKFGALEDKWVG